MIFSHAVVEQDGSVARLVAGVDAGPLALGQSLVVMQQTQTGWPEPPFAAAVLCCTQAGVLYWRDDRTVAEAKAQKVAELRDAREAFERGGFVWDGSTFDSDDKSQMRILGLVKDAERPYFTERTWRLADNTWRILSAEDARGVWAALTEHVASAFQHFASLEAQVNAATTVAEVEAVHW